MHREVMEVADFELPTERHRLALQSVVDDFSGFPFPATLLVAGSVARGAATDNSDIDMLCVVESSEVAAAAATSLMTRPLAVSAFHDIVAIQLRRFEVKVSLRIMHLRFFDDLFQPVHTQTRSIWKTHKISAETKRPELVALIDGRGRSFPFRELQDPATDGWVYRLSMSNEAGPMLNVELTMLLESRIVGVNTLGYHPAEQVVRGLKPYATSHGELPGLRLLVEESYLGDAARVTIENYIAAA